MVSASTSACLLHINYTVGAAWNVAVFKIYSNRVGKDSDRQNAKCVLAEEVQCTAEGDIHSCWGKETKLHGRNAI